VRSLNTAACGRDLESNRGEAEDTPPVLGAQSLCNSKSRSELALPRLARILPGETKTSGLRSHGWWRQAGSKGVILNMATEAETTVKMFHSPDRDVALKPDGGFRKAKTLPRNNNLAWQALTRVERLFRDAIETFAAKILGGALNRWSFGLPEQTHRPMQCYPRAFAAIIRYGHGTTLASRL
jgi:hypothetical protein